MFLRVLFVFGALCLAGADDVEVLQLSSTVHEAAQPVAESGSYLANRIAKALVPTVDAKRCGGFVDTGNGGAFYRWCTNVLSKSAANKDVFGLSYGIFTWDSWSRYLANDYNVSTRLFDCYSTEPFKGIHAKYNIPYDRRNVCVAGKAFKDADGREFEALHDHLAKRPAKGTLLKMDVEGSEWEALKSISDADLRKIDLLDMEIHFCKAMGGLNATQKKSELAQRVATLERLNKIFQVTGRDPAEPSDPDYTEANKKKHRGRDGQYSNRLDADICSNSDHSYPAPKGSQNHYSAMLSVSYVNRARLAEV